VDAVTRLTDAERPRVLIVGSAPVRAAQLRELAAASDLLICADGGGDAVQAAGLLPAIVLGDMDSIGDEARASLAAAGVIFQTHPRDKDKTDLELALDYAMTLGPSQITIVGATGGERLDHTIGNLLLLTLPAIREIDARVVDETGVEFLVAGSREFSGAAGDFVSLLPLTETVDGIVTVGLRYALCGEALSRGSTRGVSNELVGTRATITISSGLLLVRHERAVRV